MVSSCVCVCPYFVQCFTLEYQIITFPLLVSNLGLPFVQHSSNSSFASVIWIFVILKNDRLETESHQSLSALLILFTNSFVSTNAQTSTIQLLLLSLLIKTSSTYHSLKSSPPLSRGWSAHPYGLLWSLVLPHSPFSTLSISARSFPPVSAIWTPLKLFEEIENIINITSITMSQFWPLCI